MRHAYRCAIVSTIGLMSPSSELASIQPKAGFAGCAASAAESRWSPVAGSYRLDATYGRTSDEWIGSVAGLAFREDRVVLLDHGDPRVVILSDDLEPVREFGREGQGPGEFESPMIPWAHRGSWSFWYLAVSDSAIAVYDREAIEIFSHAGDFHSRQGGIPRDRLFGVRYLAIPDGGTQVAYAFDRVDRRQQKRRALETWVMTDSVPELIWTVPLRDPPHSGVGYVNPSRQARPLWAVSGRCVLVSDGASRELLRFDRTTGRQDTLLLPDWSPPPMTSAERESGRARARAGLPGAGMEPTALMAWTDLVVDPDGFIWMEAWRGDRTEPSRVAILNPSDGSLVEATIPAFPKAFGEPGTLYGVVFDSETDQSLVLRYDRNDLRGGKYR